MKRTRVICYGTAVDDTFLLSVVNTYISDKKLKRIDADAIEQAYRRAFPCEK
jgi:hypothetical protein